MATTTFTFNRNNFTKSTPDWATEGEYSKGLRFNTVTKTLQLNNSGYGRGDFTITFSGDFDYGSIHFSTPNGSIVSVSGEENGVYLLHNDTKTGSPAEAIFKNEDIVTSPKTFYVVVNGDPDNTTSLLNVSIALAKSNSIPTINPSISLSYNCPNNNLYEYEVGLHAWSPYDARDGSSTLRTKLYSPTAIASWGTNTYVYASPYLNNPALPYFYGYGSKVYRVGEEWSRSYGLKFKYELRITTHWFLKKKTKQSRKTIGPLETLDLGTDNNEPTSEACIEPVMRNVGKIRQVYENGTPIPIPPQPQQYRYYMGYDPTSKTTANSGPFTDYDIAKKKHYPITGLIHALKKHTRGIINGYNKIYSGDVNWAAIGTGAGLGILSALAGESIITGIANFFSTIPGPLPSFQVLFGAQAAAVLGTVLIVLAILFIIWKLISAFKPKTYVYKEDCRKFLHHFANTPYLNIGTSLHRDDDLEHDNAGWYSDGVYYYQQTGTAGSRTITTKQLSFVNSFVGYGDGDQPQFQFLYSLPADDPTLVTEWQKLILLPYCSGKPIPYCGGSTIFYSQAFSHTINTQCCELENCSEPKVISIPYGTVTSCINQSDADDRAEEMFSASIDYAEDYGVYAEAIDDSLIGQLEVNFTHEIKEEDNPTSMAFFWDLRSGSDAPIGTPVYYDHTGCQRLLPGYYATTGSNYPKYYYKVEEGEVAAIYTQSSAAATTVTPGGGAILKTDEGRSSNWYLKSTTLSPLTTYILNTNDRTFDVNSLITSTSFTLSAGRITSGSYTNESFLKYNAFNSTGVTNTDTTENGTGWYAPLNGWKPAEEDFFFYQNSLTLWTGGTRYAVSSSAICDGSNTGTNYYHDGGPGNPSLGDKIYDTNDIDNPTSDGFIKYTSERYLQVEEGTMVADFSCVPTSEFSGSVKLTDMQTACTASLDAVNYEHNGDTALPQIGDTVSIAGGSTLTAGFFRTATNVYQVDSNGVVIQIATCSDLGPWPTDLTVGWNAILNYGNSAWYGYETYENPTSNSGIGTGGGWGDLDHKFPLSNSLYGYQGWKAVGLVWSNDYNQLQFTMQYPDTSGYNSYIPTNWGILEIRESGGTIHSYNTSNATATDFTDNGKKYYRWTWSESSNPFGSPDTVARIDIYHEDV